MEIIVFWLLLSLVAGIIAANKGRSGFGYFLLAIVFSPLIGIIVAAVMSPVRENTEARQLDRGELRRCPACAELVRPEAIKCRHCGSAIAPVRLGGDTPPPSALSYRLGRALGSAFRRKDKL